MKHYQQRQVTIETWVDRRDDTFIKKLYDNEQKLDWRSCVRHSNGVMEWQWHATEQAAVQWCENVANRKFVEAQ